MSRRNPPPPEPATFRCHNCGKAVAREKGFFALKFECCSPGCVQVMREEHTAAERTEEKERPKFSAFTFQNGGSSSY